MTRADPPRSRWQTGAAGLALVVAATAVALSALNPKATSGDGGAADLGAQARPFADRAAVDRRALAPSRPGPVRRCGPTRGPFRPGRWPGGCWRPYGRTSPFNQPLPAHPRLAARSTAIVQRILDFGMPQSLVIGTSGSPDDFGHPVYYAQPNDPRFTLRCRGRFGACPLDGQRVRIPAKARPAAGTDAHMAVIDQRTGAEDDLYEVTSKRDDVVTFTFGGSTSIAGDGLQAGATASGFGLLAGTIRAAELERGVINHALFMTALCDSGRAVPPAVKSGRPCSAIGRSNRDAPAMGTRLQLAVDPRTVDALPVPWWTRAILRAMRRYGAFLGDTGGSSWGLQLESGSTYTSFGYPDPLVSFARRVGLPRHDGRHALALSHAVDWRRLRVIAPCVTLRRC